MSKEKCPHSLRQEGSEWKKQSIPQKHNGQDRANTLKPINSFRLKNARNKRTFRIIQIL